MTTTFTELPIVDLSVLHAETPSETDLEALSTQLYSVFATTGFAYLTNAPLSFTEDDIFGLAREFFEIPFEEKMKLAKRTFRKGHSNTYRGYFPAQAGSDNLKEGFEIGPSEPVPPSSKANDSAFVLTEPNVFPPAEQFAARAQTEQLYSELQSLSTKLLSLLAVSLDQPANRFTPLFLNSVSTLRLLHYPAPLPTQPQPEFCCSPHTDSGLLTLLHQDATGGLEVCNAAGAWIAAPYVPGSVVVNIGDLMAQLSGGRFVATRHRVRAAGRARVSVPFFCEPGVEARVGASGQERRYEDFVLGKMGTWVEFQAPVEQSDGRLGHGAVVETAVEA